MIHSWTGCWRSPSAHPRSTRRTWVFGFSGRVELGAGQGGNTQSYPSCAEDFQAGHAPRYARAESRRPRCDGYGSALPRWVPVLSAPGEPWTVGATINHPRANLNTFGRCILRHNGHASRRRLEWTCAECDINRRRATAPPAPELQDAQGVCAPREPDTVPVAPGLDFLRYVDPDTEPRADTERGSTVRHHLPVARPSRDRGNSEEPAYAAVSNTVTHPIEASKNTGDRGATAIAREAQSFRSRRASPPCPAPGSTHPGGRSQARRV